MGLSLERLPGGLLARLLLADQFSTPTLTLGVDTIGQRLEVGEGAGVDHRAGRASLNTA